MAKYLFSIFLLAAPAFAVPKEDAPTRFARLVERDGLQAKRQALDAAFPKTAEGAALSRVATLYRRATTRDNAEESAAVHGDLTALRSNPGAALRDLREGLRRLPLGFHQERRFLIQLAVRMPAPASDRADLLNDELRRVPDPREGPAAIFSAAVAAELLPAVVKDPAKVRSMIGAAMSARNDSNYRRLMAAVLRKYDPTGADQLKSRFRLK